MQSRSTKVFLPQNYQEYMLQKKKNNRLIINKQINDIDISNTKQKVNLSIHGQGMQNNINSSQSSSRNSHYNHSNKFSSLIGPLKVNEKLNHSIIEDFQEEQTKFLKLAQQVKIVQRIIYSEYKNLFQQFQNNKFSALKSKMQAYLLKLKEQTPLQLLKVNQILKKIQVQSLQNINQIQVQMQVPYGRRNTQKIDQMLNFNKFFVILNKQKRTRIYQNSKIIKYNAGQTIYKEGDINQHMYVIVKGCVKQYQIKNTSYQDKIDVNFVTYYEGSNFGQAPLIGDSNLKAKRYSTTQTTEETYLLQIANSFYKQLITNSAEDDFQKKIQALMETTIFRDTSQMFVTPLLPTLTKHLLSYGTVLIRQDQQVRRLYFVAEGTLEVMYLDRAKRNIKHLNIQQKPKSFSIKKPSSLEKSRNPSKSNNKSFSIHNTFYYPQHTQKDQKQFIYGNKKLIGDQIQYNQQIIFSTLRIGDFFGGKSFLQDIQRQKKMLNSRFFDTSLRAKLSVLSSAPKTLVYSIDEKKFFSLSDNFQKIIVEGIMNAKYFDDQSIDQKKQSQKQWKQYAQKLVENVIISKKTNRSLNFRN